MKTLRIALAAILAGAACHAGAQNLKPGLWEITHGMPGRNDQMEQAMSQMQQQMASLSPEQKKMVEEMVAKQGARAKPGGATSVKVCMTREMVERNDLPAQQGDCKTTAQQRSGNTMKMAFACTNPPSSGDGQVTFHGPESYTMKMAVTTQAAGKVEKVNMEGSGKWLAADCGSVKPPAAAARKQAPASGAQ